LEADALDAADPAGKLNFHYQDFISFHCRFVPIRADANLPFSFGMIIY